jgi:hypothetical protein
MALNPPGQLDPAALAEEVRELANDAHRVLNAPAPEGPEIDALAHRVASLQDQIRDYPFAELACWLDNVRQIIEGSA